ncbi:MAG: PAS domain-containing protein [Nitratireductor sp.]
MQLRCGMQTRYNLKIEPYRESGRINLMVTLFPSDHAMRFRNGHGDIHQAWMEAVPDALIVTDSKGIVREVNDRFLDMIHILNRKQVIGRNVNTRSALPVSTCRYCPRACGTKARFTTS